MSDRIKKVGAFLFLWGCMDIMCVRVVVVFVVDS